MTTVATERPVTGSCERCARGYDLLIPEPGSGDLHFQRIGARFRWCAGCSRIVGQTCCWEQTASLCADCGALRAAPDSSLTDAVLTRNALSGLSDATEAMGAVERRLALQPLTDEEQARDAWEDAWLETGIAIVRADSAVRTARVRGAAASVTPADARWLNEQLETPGALWEECTRAAADRLERIGLRIRALGALALTFATPADPLSDGQSVSLPVGPAVSPVTRLPTRETVRVGALPPALVQARQAERPTVASWPPSKQAPPARLDLLDLPVAGSRRSLPVRPAPAPRLPRRARPAAPPAWEGRPVLARPSRARRPAPSPPPAPTVGREVVVVLLVLLALIGLVATAAVAVALLGLTAASARAPLSA